MKKRRESRGEYVKGLRYSKGSLIFDVPASIATGALFACLPSGSTGILFGLTFFRLAGNLINIYYCNRKLKKMKESESGSTPAGSA
jgi:hypothetical protein